MATGLALTNNNLLSKHNMEKNRLFEILPLEKELDPDSEAYTEAVAIFRCFLSVPCKQLTAEEYMPQKKQKTATDLTEVNNGLSTSAKSLASSSTDTADNNIMLPADGDTSASGIIYIHDLSNEAINV